MTTPPKPRVLCVDDEPQVLEGLKLHLERRFQLSTATSGAEGLVTLGSGEPFAVVVSDMRMPEMNGAEFLSRVRAVAPHSARILLTGQTDLESAIRAVNEGQIFRFLSKPCAPEHLRAAIEGGVEQFLLRTAERELLEKTLTGSVQVLNDVLALSNPEVFGRAMRIKQYASEFGKRLEIEKRWELETAAMLSLLGLITLDREIVVKATHGHRLTAEEEKAIAGAPAVGVQLLSHIPRLEGVVAILLGVSKPRATAPAAGPPSSAEVLRIVLDFDRLEGRGRSPQAALEDMAEAKGKYDPVLLKGFAELRSETGPEGIVQVPLAEVKVGMVLAEDVRMDSGVLLAARGYVVTGAFVERVRNFPAGRLKEVVSCSVASDSDATDRKAA